MENACKDGDVATVRALLETGTVNIHAHGEFGWTPLHFASNGGHVDVVKLLLEARVDANAANEGGSTPLHSASIYGHWEIVELLLQANADPNAATQGEKKTALHYASEQGHAKVVQLLLQANANPHPASNDKLTPLHYAARDGLLEVVELLLKAKADPNVADEDGRTPLHMPSLLGHLEVVELLLQANADPNAATEDEKKTALHYASHSQIVKLLLNANADPNAADKHGLTKLHSASSEGQLETAELLIKANADLNAVDEDGDTPLHAACQFHKSEVAHALLNLGVDLHAKTNNGREPLHTCITRWWNGKVTTDTLLTLQVLVSFGATWDAMCDELVTEGKAYKAAPSLRICMLQWAQEHVDGLPFTEVPLEVAKRGAESSQKFIESLKTSTAAVLRRKICLVGPSCAGKTSFVKSITSEQPQLVHLDDRTIGIDHFPLRFEESSIRSDETKIHEVTFWDFAGQDAYQVAHSLFFSPRTLFLVCVDLEAFTTAVLQASIMSVMKRQETLLMDEFIERTVMQWIRMIVARQPTADFVFIVTKEDLLDSNTATAKLFKTRLTVKLQDVATTVQQMRSQLEKDKPLADDTFTLGLDMSVGSEPTIVFTSSTSPASVHAARKRIEELIIQSKRSFQMPDTYSQALKAIVAIRHAANANGNDVTSRINRVFAPLDTLPALLKIEPDLCRTILQTLHDLGDVLWYEDLGVELFENTVILDPLLLIDFIRQVINHTHTDVTVSHADLKFKPYWTGLSNETQMHAMKQVLQKFRLVYPDDEGRVMHWDSDLIVPAFWQTKTPASWLFLGDILRINTTKSLEGEAVRVEWEYHFEYGLPSPLFDQLVVACVCPDFKFDAGPDWIVYEEKEIAACRIMVGRDPKSLHRTIHVEAVVAEAADEDQVEELWWSFELLCGAFIDVMREYPGLAGVSSFAWDDKQTKMNLKRLMQSTRPFKKSAAKWMPPPATWKWFKEHTSKTA